MRILLTGVCGFAGSVIARTLAEDTSGSIEVIGLDNLSRGGSWTNIGDLRRRGIEFRHGDVRCASDLESFDHVDWVIDAAANPSVLAGIDGTISSRQLVENNLSGTINLLEFCKARAAGLVLLSTSRVYSIAPLAALAVAERNQAFQPDTSRTLPPGVSPRGISEQFSVAAPVSLYGATKMASEQLALEYSSAFDFPVWINRCGVLAGAGQFGRPDQGIFAFWLHSWRERRALRYVGFDTRGHQVRDCLHPRDLVSLILKQLKAGSGAEQPRTVNVSGGVKSARSLAQLSAWCTERWGERDVGADATPRPYDLPWIVLDNQLAAEGWDWHPQTDVEDIVTEIADFADARPDWIAQSS